MQAEQEKILAETLQAGSIAAIEDGYSHKTYAAVEVVKITPSGQIVTSDGRFNRDGREMSGSSFHSRWLVPMTEEIRLNILRKRLANIKWDKASDDQVKQIAAILGLQEGK